jgi:hypothetical protein
LLYKLPTSTDSIQHFALFRLLGVYRWELDAWASVRNREAEEFSIEALRKCAGERWRKWSSKEYPEHRLRFATQFPVGKLAGWGTMRALSIRDYSHDETAARVAADLSKHLLPFLQKIGTEESMFDFLVSNDEPMPWYQCSPLTRTAHIIYLANKLGLPEDRYLPALERESKFIANQLGGIDTKTFVHNLTEAARKNSLTARRTRPSDKASRAGGRGR